MSSAELLSDRWYVGRGERCRMKDWLSLQKADVRLLAYRCVLARGNIEARATNDWRFSSSKNARGGGLRWYSIGTYQPIMLATTAVCHSHCLAAIACVNKTSIFKWTTVYPCKSNFRKFYHQTFLPPFFFCLFSTRQLFLLSVYSQLEHTITNGQFRALILFYSFIFLLLWCTTPYTLNLGPADAFHEEPIIKTKSKMRL
jgi:hypothetical protein